MKTQAQLRTELYNALYNDTVITNNIFWIGRPTASSSFPCIIYSFLDTTGAYAFTEWLTSEKVIIQLDVYTGTKDKTSMDTTINRLNTIMGGLGYRNIGAVAEFFLEDIRKIVRPTRWEKWNV